jgi:ribosomal protein S9
MAVSNADIQAKVTELQGKLDIEQQQVADLIAAKDADNTAKQAVIDQLNQTVLDLQAIIDSGGGGTDAERQAILDSLTTAIADLEATVAP